MGIEKPSPNKRRVTEDRPACRAAPGAGRRDCYWLYVVTGCKSEPNLREPIKNPPRFPWREACLPRYSVFPYFRGQYTAIERMAPAI